MELQIIRLTSEKEKNERKMATGPKKDVKMSHLDVQYILVKCKRYKRYKEIKNMTIYYYNIVRMRKSKVPTEVLLDSQSE